MVTRIEVFKPVEECWSVISEINPGEIGQLTQNLEDRRLYYLVECNIFDDETKIHKVPDKKIIHLSGETHEVAEEVLDGKFIFKRLMEGEVFMINVKSDGRDHGELLKISHLNS